MPMSQKASYPMAHSQTSGHRRTVRCLLGFALLLAAIGGSSREVQTSSAPDSAGTDFWVTFPGNAFCCGTPTLSLFITGETDTSGTVAIPGLGFETPFSVVAGGVEP